MLLLISIDEFDYIVDIGFGSMVHCVPLRLEEKKEHITSKGIYKINSTEEGLLLKTKLNDELNGVHYICLIYLNNIMKTLN